MGGALNRHIVLGLLALLATAVACGTSAIPSPTPTPASEPAAAPTPTPSPLPGPPPGSTLQCGDVITSDTLLANDLDCTGNALIIGADNVRLDLGGRTLSGPGRGPYIWPNRALSSVGVHAKGRENVWIGNGTVARFGTGVLMDNTTGSEVNGLTATGSFYGIYLVDATENVLADNMVSRNTYGIHLQSSSRNVAVGNDSSGNLYQSPGGYGINLFGSHDNEIKDNIMRANENQGIWTIQSRGNAIYRNDLVGQDFSGGGRGNGVDDLGANTWHSEELKQGNYWSDYEGEDADGDGIGDTPHPVPGGGNAKDLYPSMKPYRWKGGT